MKSKKFACIIIMLFSAVSCVKNDPAKETGAKTMPMVSMINHIKSTEKVSLHYTPVAERKSVNASARPLLTEWNFDNSLKTTYDDTSVVVYATPSNSDVNKNFGLVIINTTDTTEVIETYSTVPGGRHVVYSSPDSTVEYMAYDVTDDGHILSVTDAVEDNALLPPVINLFGCVSRSFSGCAHDKWCSVACYNTTLFSILGCTLGWGIGCAGGWLHLNVPTDTIPTIIKLINHPDSLPFSTDTIPYNP